MDIKAILIAVGVIAVIGIIIGIVLGIAEKVFHVEVNEKETDVTAILLPSKKNPMDCITITIDKKLDKETCKNLINHLVKEKIINVDHPDFRKTIVEYLNNL